MNCPNKNLPEWKALEAKVGYEEALVLFIKNGYEIPDIDNLDPIRNITIDNIDSLSKALDKISKLRDKSLENFVLLYKSNKGTEAERLAIIKHLESYKNYSVEKYFTSMHSFLDRGIGIMDTLMSNKGYERETLEFMNSFMGAYDLAALLGTQAQYVSDNFVDKTLRAKYKTTIGELAELKDKYYTFSRKAVGELLAKESTIVRQQYKEKFEKEFDSVHETSLSSTLTAGEREKLIRLKDTNRRLYVMSQIEANEKKISEEEYKHVIKLLGTSPKDITTLALYTTSQKGYRSQLLQLVVKKLSDTEAVIDRKFIKTHDAYIKLHSDFIAKRRKDFEKFTITNQLDLYGDIIERDLNGNPTGYYVRSSGIMNSYYSELRKIENDVDDLYLENKEAEGDALLTKWMDENLMDHVDRNSDLYNLKQSDLKKKNHNHQYSKLLNLKKNGDSTLYDMYNKLRELNKASDKLVGNHDKLGHKIPSINKTGGEQLSENKLSGVVNTVVDKVAAMKNNPDYAEAQQTSKEGDVIYRTVDTNDNPIHKVNVPFRQPVNLKYQSYDLVGNALSNHYASINYAEKEQLRIYLETLKTLMDNDMQVNKTVGFKDVMNMIPGFERLTRQKQATTNVSGKAIESNIAKAFAFISEDRLYGEHAMPTIIAGVDLNKVAGNMISYSATMMLGFNVNAAIVNLINGKTMNFLESLSNNHYGVKNLLNAEGYYVGDFMRILQDAESLDPTSRTKLLQREYLDSSMDFNYLENHLKNDNRFKRIFTSKLMTLGQSMGEHYIQSTLMYSVMDNIKVMKDGKYVNKKGEVVEDRNDAANMIDFYEFKGSSMKFKDGFTIEGHKTFDARAQNEVRNKVKDVLESLQGQYDKRNKTLLERFWYGKLITFLRKWMGPAYSKHFGGFGLAEITSDKVFYSESQQKYKEGVYTSTFRMLNFMRKELGKVKLRDLASLKEAGVNVGERWKNAQSIERANIRFAVGEIGVFILMYCLANLAEPDDDEELTKEERARRYALAYFAYRLHSELGQFVVSLGMIDNTIRTVNTPSAVLNTASQTLDLLEQLGSPMEEYKSGDHKYESKLKVKLERSFNPFYKLWDSDFEDSYNYIKNGSKFN